MQDIQTLFLRKELVRSVLSDRINRGPVEVRMVSRVVVAQNCHPRHLNPAYAVAGPVYVVQSAKETN